MTGARGGRRVLTDEGEIIIAMSFLTENDIAINNDLAAHESGHGLFHLGHADSESVLSGKIRPYGDWWDNRGLQYAILDGLHKYILGWLDISQIKIIVSSGEYWLDQRELASGGTKLLVIFLKYGGYDSSNYYHNKRLIYLEYHRGLGEFDSQLHFYNKNEAVDPNNLVLFRKYGEHYNTLVCVASDDGNDCLDLAQEFCDSMYENLEHYGVCVQVLEKKETNAGQAKVKITLTEDYSFPTPNPPQTPTPSPTPTPTSTPTPTPCEADILTVSPPSPLNLKRKTSGEATVTITSADGCAVEGETVTAEIISAKSKRRITVSPPERDTDENGQAVFIITAQKKLGYAAVSFHSGGLEKLLTVNVSRK